MNFTFENGGDVPVNIKVIGIGGGGGNAINRMIASGIRGVDYIAVNTDKQVLNFSAATMKLQLGAKLTGGLGAGSNPEVGRKAAQESEDEIRKLLEGTQMVFITAGMGGGTGTGGAPVVAQIAKDMGILTVGVVTRPFTYEGKRRIEQADQGIAELREKVDALVVVPNERLKYVSEQKITLKNAFEVADNVLRQAVQGISELITVPGLINLDFADICTVMRNAGYTHMGVGRASGKEKATEAARMAIQSPLLETSIDGARGLLVNVTGSPDIGLEEVDDAAQMIREAAHPDAHIIFGAAIDDELDDEMHITVIATGFDDKPSLPPEGLFSGAKPAEAAAQSAAKEAVGVGASAAQPHGEQQPKAAPAPQPRPAASDSRGSDELFDDIMKIFKNRT